MLLFSNLFSVMLLTYRQFKQWIQWPCLHSSMLYYLRPSVLDYTRTQATLKYDLSWWQYLLQVFVYMFRRSLAGNCKELHVQKLIQRGLTWPVFNLQLQPWLLFCIDFPEVYLKHSKSNPDTPGQASCSILIRGNCSENFLQKVCGKSNI